MRKNINSETTFIWSTLWGNCFCKFLICWRTLINSCKTAPKDSKETWWQDCHSSADLQKSAATSFCSAEAKTSPADSLFCSFVKNGWKMAHNGYSVGPNPQPATLNLQPSTHNPQPANPALPLWANLMGNRQIRNNFYNSDQNSPKRKVLYK